MKWRLASHSYSRKQTVAKPPPSGHSLVAKDAPKTGHCLGVTTMAAFGN